MITDPDDAKKRIRARIQELAKELGHDARGLNDDDMIPRAGVLDSASLMALIVWYENEFGVSTDEEELTLDNFGSVNLMAEYLIRNG